MHDRTIDDDRIADIISDFFAQSNDFNGIDLKVLATRLQCNLDELWKRLRPLLQDGKITLAFESHALNPHIKRFKELPVNIQISKLDTEDAAGICAYPSPALLKHRIGAQFDDRPYTKRLALAEAQLVPFFFELPVLERYFRDPRYSCWFGDSEGTISISNDAYQSEKTIERDKISIQSFGIGYTSNRERVVAVYLRDLSGLSSEHQFYWRTHEESTTCTMNSDFERATIWGDWPQFYSAYSAVIEEQLEINKLCELIGKPHLFRETFEEHKRPIGFSSMLRPTQACFDEFVHLLDKMLSDNLDKNFFKNDVPFEERIVRDDGSIEVRPLGTLTLLEHWLKRHYKNRDGEDVSREVVAPFKEIRKARHPVAHAIGRDQYDLSLPSKQDGFVSLAKNGLARLRWILSSHPRARTYLPHEWLDSDKIVFY
jgi:hypothetical protein